MKKYKMGGWIFQDYSEHEAPFTSLDEAWQCAYQIFDTVDFVFEVES